MYNWLVNWFGAQQSSKASEHTLSEQAQSLIRESFAGVPEVEDYHTHIGGVGHNESGCYVNPSFRQWWHPLNYWKYGIFLSGAGVDPNSNQIDQDYITRLSKLVADIRSSHRWGKQLLLALDYWYDADGTRRADKTLLHVPNEYCVRVAEAHPHLFRAAVSVHPFRPDAVVELERWGARGVRDVKWLPNAMGFEPSDPKCLPLYAVMRKWNMVLLCHVGREHSLDVAGELPGNPLHLRSALDAGVKVIAAHCASEGSNPDLDHPEQPTVSNFLLFQRLMDDPKYQNLLFADISSLFLIPRVGAALATILDRVDWHPRMVNGSDYPLPGIGVATSTRWLQTKGFLDAEKVPLLNEIFVHNPLLYDFVLKRCLRSPQTGKQFSPTVFGWNEALFGAAVPPLAPGATAATFA